MKISRQVGTASQIIQVFVQNATVTTGAGLANIIGSSVSYSWFRNNQASVSSGTASTAGAMGVYSTSAWVELSSSEALGWYQFGPPDGVFTSGDSVGIHFYGAPNMAPLPLEIELTKTNNQQYDSSKVFLAFTSTSPANIISIVNSPAVTSAAGQLRVSTQALPTTTNANLLEIYGSPAVTSGAGILTVSTQTLAAGAGDIISVYGSPIVTSGAGIINVSTQTLAAAGSDILTVYGSPIVTSGAGIFQVSTQVLLSTTFANVVQIIGQIAQTTAAGVLRVSTQALTVPDNVGIANISTVVNNPLTESYRTNGATGTIAQLMYEMVAHMGEVAITGTTKTVNSLDHTTPAETFQLDNSSAPSAITRIT